MNTTAPLKAPLGFGIPTEDLYSICDILRTMGLSPDYGYAATLLLPDLYPDAQLTTRCGVIVGWNPRLRISYTMVSMWNTTQDGGIIDILPQVAGRKLGLRTKMPRLVIGAPDRITARYKLAYIPDSPELRKKLAASAHGELSRVAHQMTVQRDSEPRKNILIALRDGAIQTRSNLIRPQRSAELEAAAQRLRPPARDFERPQRRELANRIGHTLRFSGVVGQVVGPRRCVIDPIDVRTGCRLADHVWVVCNVGDPGKRLTATGKVRRYCSQRGNVDFALTDIHEIRIDEVGQ